MTSCITFPKVLRYYSASLPPDLEKLSTPMTGKEDGSKSIEVLANRIEDFIKELGLSKKLSDYGTEQKDLEFILGKLGQTDDTFKDCLNSML